MASGEAECLGGTRGNPMQWDQIPLWSSRAMAQQGRAVGSWSTSLLQHHWDRGWWLWGPDGGVEEALRNAGQGQSGRWCPQSPWEEVVQSSSRNISIPRNLKAGLLHKATGIFYFHLWPPEHTVATDLMVSSPLWEVARYCICQFFSKWPFASFWKDMKKRCSQQDLFWYMLLQIFRSSPFWMNFISWSHYQAHPPREPCKIHYQNLLRHKTTHSPYNPPAPLHSLGDNQDENTHKKAERVRTTNLCLTALENERLLRTR